jgi:hypothetical protein
MLDAASPSGIFLENFSRADTFLGVRFRTSEQNNREFARQISNPGQMPFAMALFFAKRHHRDRHCTPSLVVSIFFFLIGRHPRCSIAAFPSGKPFGLLHP